MPDEGPSPEEVRRRVRGALEGRQPQSLAAEGFVPAAVLVPILARRGGATVLLTRRTHDVEHHKGQISFPGGRNEPGEDLLRTALRETREEVGLGEERVEVLGRLDDRASPFGYVVSPFVGLVPEPPDELVIQAGEVVELFEVPLGRLLDRRALRTEWWEATRFPPGARREELLGLRRRSEDLDPESGRYAVHFFDIGRGPDGAVWGLTAGILKDLLDRAFRQT